MFTDNENLKPLVRKNDNPERKLVAEQIKRYIKRYIRLKRSFYPQTTTIEVDEETMNMIDFWYLEEDL